MEITKNIEKLNIELNNYKDIRQIINEKKRKKDLYILKYIKNTRQPEILDINLINYRALYFYFRKNFIENKKTLELKNFFNEIKDNRSKVFIDFFGEEKKILIAIKETNFPHLIGYKNKDKSNKKFLENIYYEVDLIKDYQEHGCDNSKIESLSWIWETLKKPFFIFDNKGIKNRSKLKKDTSLCFVKSKKNINNDFIYHYVGLKHIPNECKKNRYVINSHHKLTKKEFYQKFDTRKVIYKFSREKYEKDLE